MNNKRRNWIATPTETKIAWIVASATALLVIGAFLWPQMESQKPETTTVMKEKPEDVPIGKIIAKVQDSEKHQIKAEAEPVPVTQPAPEPEPAPVINKETPVITPKVTAAPVAKPMKPSSTISAGYYVQTGAFSDHKRAEALMKRLSNNWKTQIHKKPNNLFAVWSGPYANSKEATAAKNSIAIRTKIKGFIVKN
ncbi:MAG TPA: SPOR domain-containing protein [Mariprofundaceae bacterium]|nr:SPOR domain-containing protein [Mariprofundaceae bacterium]